MKFNAMPAFRAKARILMDAADYDGGGDGRVRARRVACLSLYPDDGPSVRHRIALYRPLWAAEGVDLRLFAFATHRLYAIRRRFGVRWTVEKMMWMAFGTLRLALRLPLLRGYDVVVIHREAFPLGPPLFELLAAWINPRLVFDFDDAIWTAPSGEVDQRQLFWDKDRVAKIITRARHVVAGSRYLAAYAHGHNPHVTIIPTPYDDLGDRGGHDDGLPVVVWIGNLGNAWYVQAQMPALERAARQTPFVLRLIGGVDMTEVHSGELPIERRAWSAEEELALGEAAIGIMPVPDLDYERGKCGFKIVQYWSAGLAVIASPVGANIDMVAHGRDGLLASTEQEWEEAIVCLLNDEARRSAVAAAGRATFLAGYTRALGARNWLDVFDRVMSPAR